MPGVLAVLTGQDALADGLKRIPHLAAPGTPPDIVLHNRDGSPVPVAPHHVLPADRVRHVGTAVAFVIAETIAQAKDAAEKVVVDYEPLPAVTQGIASLAKDAPRLYDDLPNVMIDAEVGDAAATDAAFAAAAHVTRLETWVNRVTGVPMEPRSAVGLYDERDRPLHALCRLGRRRAAEGELAADSRRAGRFRARRDTARSAAISAPETASSPNSRWWCGASQRVGRPVKWTCGASAKLSSAITMGRDLVVEPSWRSTRRAASWRCAARTSAMSARIRRLDVPLVKGVAILDVAVYRVPVVAHQGACRAVEQYVADRRPIAAPGGPKSIYRHGAADRHRRAASTASIASSCARRNLIPPIGVPVSESA